MGLFSRSTPEQVCGLAFCEFGLRAQMMDCEDRGVTQPLDEEFVPLMDNANLNRSDGLAETLEALFTGATPMLEFEGGAPSGGRFAVTEGFDSELDHVARQVEGVDGYEGETVVGVPVAFDRSARDTLRQRVEDCGFDVQQVVSNDIGYALLGATEYEVEHGGSEHPVAVVDMSIESTTVTLADVDTDQHRVTVRGRETAPIGVGTVLYDIVGNVLIEAGLDEGDLSWGLVSQMFDEARQVLDPDVTTTRGTIRIGGERYTLEFGERHWSGPVVSLMEHAEAVATNFVSQSEYIPEDMHQILISGFGSEGPAGFELVEHIAAQFVRDDAMARQMGNRYGPDRVVYGNLFTPDMGAADIARVVNETGATLDVLEPLDIEAN